MYSKVAKVVLKHGAAVAKGVRIAADTHASVHKALRAQQSTNDRSVVTTQNDVARVFRKKKRSKASIRKEKFRKRVVAATTSDQPFSSYMETQLIPITANYVPAIGATNFQLVLGNDQLATINYGDLTNANRDLPRMFTYWANPAGMPAAGAGTGAPSVSNLNTQDLNITHQRMQMSLLNLTNIVLNFDIYQFVAAIDIEQLNYSTPAAAWTQCLLDTYEARAATRPGQTFNGSTPLDVPGFGKYWRLLKKDRVSLGGGQQCETLMTGLHRRKINAIQVLSKYALKGVTQNFMIVGGIGNNVLLPPGNAFSAVFTKVTHFKTNGDGINGPDRPVIHSAAY